MGRRMSRMKQTQHPGRIFSVMAVLLCAAFCYNWQLGAASFWEDESWLGIAIADGLPELHTFAITKGVHPPLYFDLAWGWTQLVGNSELALRYLGALITLIGVALVYRTGADWQGHRAGFWAALLTAGAIFVIYMTRLARQYTLFYTLSILVILLYWRWQKLPQRHRYLLGMVLAQTALLYTHYFGAFILGTVALHGLLTLRWRDKFKLLGAIVGVGLGFALWIPSLQTQIRLAPPGGIGYAVRELVAALRDALDRMMNGTLDAGGAIALLGVASLVTQRRWRIALLLFIWLVVTLALIFGYNTLIQPIYIDRNILFTLPGVALLGGIGLAWLTRWRIGWLIALILVGIYLGYGASIYGSFWWITPDWRDAAQKIAQDARADDVFVLDGEQWSLDYYFRRFMGERVAFVSMDDFIRQPIRGKRIWLIDGRLAVNFDAIDALPADYVQTRRVVVLPIVAELYQHPPEETLTIFGDQIALSYTDPREKVTAAPGDTLTLDMWWQAVKPPEFDYSVSVVIIGANGVLTQSDAGFDNGRVSAYALPFDSWLLDTRHLLLPADAPPGDYQVMVTVYDWRDNSRLPTRVTDADNLFPLLTLTVQ
jgi:hypothetical protein